jgi:hypothetical protein
MLWEEEEQVFGMVAASQVLVYIQQHEDAASQKQ